MVRNQIVRHNGQLFQVLLLLSSTENIAVRTDKAISNLSSWARSELIERGTDPNLVNKSNFDYEVLKKCEVEAVSLKRRPNACS